MQSLVPNQCKILNESTEEVAWQLNFIDDNFFAKPNLYKPRSLCLSSQDFLLTVQLLLQLGYLHG
jgi:hypothetical protein